MDYVLVKFSPEEWAFCQDIMRRYFERNKKYHEYKVEKGLLKVNSKPRKKMRESVKYEIIKE